MGKKLESHMIPLTKLFSQDFFFNIPDYQRPFLWDREHFDNLIDDLISADQDEPYFLGTLVLHELKPSQYDVVDGQQRLTALCILLACLRDSPAIAGNKENADLMNGLHGKIIQPKQPLDGIPEKKRLQVRDQGAFNALIGKLGGAATELPEINQQSASGQRYELARSVFWGKILLMRTDEAEQFAKFVAQQCHLIYLATDSFEDAFRLFSVVNDRGKQLRRIDVIKAYNLDPGTIPGELSRSQYAKKWEQMEERLGEANFEEIFHLLRLIYVQDKPQADLHSEFATRILGKKGKPDRGAEFMDELAEYVELYDSLFVDRDYLDDNDEANSKYRTIMEAMDKYFTASEWRACLLYFAKKFGKANLYHFMLRIEKIYLDHWVRIVRKDERYATYRKILRKIESETAPDIVVDSIEIDVQHIRDACKAPQFYGAGHAKYLLVRAEIVSSELEHPRHFQVRSIEHVLPQNPAPDSQWSKVFDGTTHNELVNTSGNLVLLSKSKNSSAGRREFEEKKTTYLMPRVSDFPRSMEVLDYLEWTPEIVRKRTEEFASKVLTDP